MNIKSMTFPHQSGVGGTEDWVIDHMDFGQFISEEDWKTDEARCIADLRKHALSEIAIAMVDKGYGMVDSQYDVARRGYHIATRVKLMRPVEK